MLGHFAVRVAELIAGLEAAVQDGPDYRIAGLLRGADDYVVKPIEPRELLARYPAVLRRMPPPSPEAAAPRQPVRFGGCLLDLVALPEPSSALPSRLRRDNPDLFTRSD